MPRPHRVVPAGHVYHVLNRACERRTIFRNASEYWAFIDLLEAAQTRIPMRICAYAVMPNHWHLVVWPEADNAVSAYIHWVTTMHSLQFRRLRGDVGYGHVYQDRFHCFPVETASYYTQVIRYVEANALRANLVARAENWPWSSACERIRGRRLIVPGPIGEPDNWLQLVNTVPAEDELTSLRASAGSGRPYGSLDWVTRTAGELGLEHQLRPRGRPRKIGTLLEASKMRLI